MLAQKWPDEAGRTAYLAGFHAAQALIFERQDRTPKSHSGVQTVLASLTRDEVGFDIELRRFLGRAYNLKAVADYETGPHAVVTHEQAADAIASAVLFVEAIKWLVDGGATD